MPVLLSPIWLLAFTAIVLPVIIHLWNDRKGRTFYIGSIFLLSKDARRQSRTLQLSEKWLLVVRCLLLGMLALLLARPVWKGIRVAAHAGGWVVVSDSAIAQGRYKGEIDSLVGRGMVLRHMAGPDWWKGFVALDREAPVGMPFYLFSDGGVRHFNGVRPRTSREVHWAIDNGRADSVVARVVAAWRASGDSVVVMRLESRATGRVYHYVTLPAAQVQDGVLVDTQAVRISIFTDPGYASDGRYLVAALKAVKTYTKRDLRISVGTARDAGEGMGGDWLIWLSDRPLPLHVAARHILMYSVGKDVAVNSTFYGDGNVRFPVTRMLVDSSSHDDAGIWRDGFGRPLLTYDDAQHIYRLYTHIDPAWNGMVYDAAMPALWGRLVLGGGVDPGEDLRVLDPQQIKPVTDERAAIGTKEVRIAAVDLAPVCWVLVFLLFVLERIISHRFMQTTNND